MVPEIWSVTDKFFFILDRFLLFYPPENPVNQNLEKLKKNTWRYHHFTKVLQRSRSYATLFRKTLKLLEILYLCTINYTHMMNGSWDMEYDGQDFFSFWTIFCPFTPLTTQKIKILKKWKKWYYHFTHVYHKWQSYDVWFLRYEARRREFFVILDHFFHF